MKQHMNQQIEIKMEQPPKEDSMNQFTEQRINQQNNDHMQQARILDHPILGPVEERESVTFSFNNEQIQALRGDTIASALLANGIRTLRCQEEYGTPRGFYCNIGHCFECRVHVNGKEGVRACLTPIEEGMDVQPGEVLPNPLKKKGSASHA